MPIELVDTYWADCSAGLYKYHNDIVTNAADKGITLLKNQGALPLKKEETIAFRTNSRGYYNGIGGESALRQEELRRQAVHDLPKTA